MTRFKDGWIFDEVVGQKKELFKILNLPLPTCEQFINEQSDVAEVPDELMDIEEIAEETTDLEITDL